MKYLRLILHPIVAAVFIGLCFDLKQVLAISFFSFSVAFYFLSDTQRRN